MQRSACCHSKSMFDPLEISALITDPHTVVCVATGGEMSTLTGLHSRCASCTLSSARSHELGPASVNHKDVQREAELGGLEKKS